MANASPADIRNNLDPGAVDALADQLHALNCLVIGDPPQEWPDSHRDADRSKARFVLMGLREASANIGLVAGGGLIEQDVIAKVNAGALLTFAVWSLPKDVVLALFRDAPHAFTTAYDAATKAYGVSQSRGPVMHSLGAVADQRAMEDMVLKTVEKLKKERVL